MIGIHFFSPAHVMKLVEVVRGEDSSDQVISEVMTLCSKEMKFCFLFNLSISKNNKIEKFQCLSIMPQGLLGTD